MSLDSLHTSPSVETKTDVYTDLNGLQNLKASARKDAKEALPEVARQFEAVMISMMIKNLRKTGMEDPIFKSQALDSYRDMYDQQLGMELSKGRGIGFAKTIVEQMQYQSAQQAHPSEKNTLAADTAQLQIPQRRHFPDHYSSPASSLSEKGSIEPVESTQSVTSNNASFDSPEQFIEKLWPLAEQTAQKMGVSPELILSQAALETGWGKHVISDGQKSSYNLFNIKADQQWSGGRVETSSLEYEQGKPSKQNSVFRSYDNFEQSFNDYATFIQNSPRYKNALDNVGKMEQSLHDESYIKGIHKAGYATDPSYSNKVLRVLKSESVQNQVLNQTKLAAK